MLNSPPVTVVVKLFFLFPAKKMIVYGIVIYKTTKTRKHI